MMEIKNQKMKKQTIKLLKDHHMQQRWYKNGFLIFKKDYYRKTWEKSLKVYHGTISGLR